MKKFVFTKGLYMACLSLCIAFAISVKAHTVLVKEQPPFHYILGSYGSFDKAFEFANFLRQQGLDAQIVYPKPGSTTYRVSGFRHNDRNVLQQFAARNFNGKFKGWIYEEKTDDSPIQLIGAAPPPAPPATVDPGAGGFRAEDELEGMVYYLITNSYSDYESASRRMEELKVNGYEPDVLLPTYSSPYYRVYVFVTKEKDQIKAYQTMLQRTGRDKGWIFEQTANDAIMSGGYSDLDTDPVEKNSTSYSSKSTGKTTYSESEYGFHLIGASYKDLPSAQSFAFSMQAMGFYPVILSPDTKSSYYRVSLYQTHTRREMDVYSQQVKKNMANKFWILEL